MRDFRLCLFPMHQFYSSCTNISIYRRARLIYYLMNNIKKLQENRCETGGLIGCRLVATMGESVTE